MGFGASMGIRTGAAVVRIGAQTGASGKRIDALGRKVKTLHARFRSLRRGFGDVRMGFMGVAQGMRPAVFAGIAASALGVREALNFNQEIANLTTVVGDLGDQGPAVKRTIKNLALDPRNAATAIEAAQAYTMMARSGVDAGERMKASAIALRLASLDTKISSEQASIFLVKTARQFNMSFEEIGDRLARSADAIPGNINDITTAMQYAGPAALQMGLDIDEALAMVMGATTRMKASRAGTSIGQLLTVFAKPTKRAALDKYLKAGGKGSVFNPDTGKMRNMGGILSDISNVFTRMDDQARGEAMFEVFGIRATRAITMLMKAAETAGQSYDDMLAKAKAGITLEQKAEQRMKGAMAQLKYIRTSLGVIAIDFFGALFGGKGMGNFSKTIGDVAKAFGMLIDGASAAERTTAGFSDGVWAAASGIKEAVAGVQNAFAWLGEKIKWVAGLFGMEGTQEITKFLITFIAISPVILVVGMGLTMLMSIVRGVAMIFMGLGRVGWTVISMYKSMSVWIWKATASGAASAAVTSRLSRAWSWLGTQVGLARTKFVIAYAAMRLQPGILGKIGIGAKIAGIGLKGLARGLIAALGPIGLVYAATELLSSLFSAFTGEVAETKDELARPTSISLAPTRARTSTELMRDFAGYRGSVGQMGYGGRGAGGAGYSASLPEQFAGRGGGSIRGREEIFKQLWKIAKAGEGAEFVEGKLNALGLSTEKVASMVSSRGEQLNDTIDSIGASMTNLIKMHEATANAAEVAAWDRTEDNLNAYAAAQRKEAAARAEFELSVKNSAKSLDLIFSELEAASSERAAALAGGVDASAEANAAAADKKMKKCLESTVNLNVGGRELASVVSRAQLDVNERGGASVHPYQRHRVVQDGAEPVSGMA